jgi:hypothetical protein
MTKRCTYCDHLTEDDGEARCPYDNSLLVAAGPDAGSPRPAEPAETPGPAGLVIMRLRFEDGTDLEVRPGEQVRLGRDRDWSPHAKLLETTAQVSRRHATVGLRESGSAWILAEPNTKNMTYADETPVEPERATTIEDGCTLRLSRRLTIRVTIEPHHRATQVTT